MSFQFPLENRQRRRFTKTVRKFIPKTSRGRCESHVTSFLVRSLDNKPGPLSGGAQSWFVFSGTSVLELSHDRKLTRGKVVDSLVDITLLRKASTNLSRVAIKWDKSVKRGQDTTCFF